MIDIHCHILHGLDDGAQSLDESIKMAMQAEDDGVHHIFATPHFTNQYNTHYDLILEKIAELQKELKHRNIDVSIYPGNEVRLESINFLMKHIESSSFHYLGKNNNFILLEQRWSGYDPMIMEAIQYFIDQDIIPIVAHPERHPYIRKKPDRLHEMIERGAWTQVSVDSMIGKNGEDAKEFSLVLLEEDLIHTIASDAHNTIRKINLSAGYDVIREKSGNEKAKEIQQRIERIL